MKKIVFTLQLTQPQLKRVQDIAQGWEIVSGKDKTEWQHHLKDALVIAGWNGTVQEAFLADPDFAVNWVHNWGAGVDRLPLEAFQERGVTLTNSSGVHAYPISETILAFMLGMTRKIHAYVRNQQQHIWHHANLSAEMHGKTVGILGVGAIGLETARVCKAFGMDVLGVRRSGAPSEFVDKMYTMDDLSTVLALSDYVVNTLPHTKETNHMMGQSEFTAMKPSAFYINIGRGGTTDETALINALQSGQIAGAGLDVFETEPLPVESPLWDMENAILTPHTSGSTEHYNDRALDIFTENLAQFVVDRTVSRNVVNLELEY
ncbi:D-2-hydroxyacid dehydrogenase [Alicyclobacillus ferrooxydans]|uniref:2-hydroxyacid dehydrogenase n=1 Tax=Alicyclobacillus ferrooxydans TaxID=471514 RepID=A0A0P9D5Q8_9BACL|nr:D-2-hydroxyacid dehydrogenase [Alicyclobacillus ferrooxydans]KPV44756.1 2-hydroxyacid dehydrogenase [Alicyclobacillus ferrooxydans]